MKPGVRTSIRDLYDMQRVLVAEALNPETKPADKAKCAQAWERLEERKRILLNKPLPGSLKPQSPRRTRPSLLSMPTVAPH